MKPRHFINSTKRDMKHFSFFILLFSFFTVSCSKSEIAELQGNDETTTFTLSVNELQTPAAKAGTRATSTVTPARYVMEVWSEDGTTAEKVFEDGTKNHAEITTGSSFTVVLDKEKAYTCLFWADDNATYDAASLKAVTLNSGKTDYTEAYYAKVAVAKGKKPAVTVSLKRAVAKITLTENAGVNVTNNLALKLSNIFPQFNALTGSAIGTPAKWSKTVKPAATTGIITTLYFFANSAQELTELKFTYATEPEKTVSNVPYQQNYATNIKGEYSSLGSFTFTVTADDTWSTPENEVPTEATPN